MLEPRQIFSEDVAERAEDYRPSNAAECVPEHERPIWHVRDAGEHRGPASKERNKSTEKHSLRSMLLEEVVHPRDFALIEPHVSTVVVDDSNSALFADPISR